VGHGRRQRRVPATLDGETAGVVDPQHSEGRDLKQKVGELVLDLDVLKEASKDRPFPPKTSDE
jgi:hypothetical protein